MRVLPAGPRALLLECADLDEALALHRRFWERERPSGLVDAVPGARTLLLVAASPDHLTALRTSVDAVLAGRASDTAAVDSGLDVVEGTVGRAGTVGGPGTVGEPPPFEVEVVEVEVPVRYDGPDLEEVAEHTGLSPQDVVAAHTGTPWTVGFGGFAPGFAYLAGGDPRLAVPRRPEPRPRVPAGAVGLAGSFSGIYPRASPGGWQLIGSTDVALWDLAADPPALLRPGMRVRFVDAGAGSPAAGTSVVGPVSTATLPATGAGAVANAGAGAGTGTRRTGTRGDLTRGGLRRPYLEVLRTGPLALVQDAGRPGHGGVGVGPSGAADRSAHALGARLLGQDVGTSAIEVHAGGLEVRAHGAVTVVLTGAPSRATVDGVPVGHAAPVHVADGSVLRVAAPVRGLRTYVSVRGGIEVPAVLGSRSTDTLSGLGPEPLRAGALLPVGRTTGLPTLDVAPVALIPDGLLVLDVLPGPRLEWLADPDDLARGAWAVGEASDRVGVRLTGPRLHRPPALEGRELESEGVVRGGVQVPPDGRPVVFLADHPVTGGYPVVAVLSEPASDLLAQAVPGQGVRLRWS